MTIRLNAQETLILKGIVERKSVREIGEDINTTYGYAQRIIKRLEGSGLVINPAPGKARSKSVSPEALEYLRANGYIKTELFPR